MATTTEVVIVGAGPTGLLLAGDLAAAGVGCVIVEKRTEESPLTRAFAVHARTLEVLDARGVADELIDTGTRLDELNFLGNVRLDLSRLPSRFRYVLVTPQYETERVLERRARALGAEFRHGAEVVGLRQDSGTVEVDLRDHDGAVQTISAGYVVGADGVRSMVRHALGMSFPGRSVVRSVMLADVRLAEPPADVLTFQAVGDAFAFLAPYGDGWYRVIAWNRNRQLPDSAPVDLAEVREVTHRVLGTDYGMRDPRWMSRFHSDERQVPRYRIGRVFLAGNAAHVHSPAGGQGMNTSIQDAANLGWKLAAAVNGTTDLLDTYHAERHPVGQQVLMGSGAILRLALVGPRPLRIGRGILASTATSIRPVSRRMAGAVSGIGISYPAPHGAHPLTGRRVSDIALTDGRRLYEVLRGGRFVLVSPPDMPAPTIDGLAAQVECATSTAPTRMTVLVRPDAYIGWAAPHPDQPAIQAALTGWCGQPTAS
jgi:2-polyprenyl-6-methoxyphenol hydroxylase-like FAD-dependent oxidoreductase